MVCGSRHWDNFDRVLHRLRWLEEGAIVMHGAAYGADACAHDAVVQIPHLELEVYAPDASRPSPQRYHERNDAMLDQADYVIAFWDGKSRGTASVLKKVRERGLPYEVHG
jgi:uncharacterized phage-like protein YoqJ